MSVAPQLRCEVEAWIAADPDPDDRAELVGMLAAGERPEVAADLALRFDGRLQFGTAGLRAPVGAGPRRINRAVVRATTAGVAAWLSATVPGAAGRGVVVGCDGRHRSRQLWRETAATFAGAGIRVHLLEPEQPTPLLAFATRHLGAAAGVMVTASHNPAPDNGYKLYLADGAQVVAPHDAAIEAAIAAVGDLRTVPVAAVDDPLVRPAGHPVVDAYVAAVVAAAPRPAGARPLRVVHTALHGVSTDLVAAAVAAAGYEPLVGVEAQAQPDPAFPTVAYPNPEEPGALDLALELATRVGADLVVANHPDGDRLAVACPAGEQGWRVLSGDELGVILGSGVLDGSIAAGGDSSGAAGVAGGDGTPVVAASLVSSSLLAAMAAGAEVRYVETLTGFKWIARAADDVPGGRLAFGYEEALGYAVGGLVRDKDGIGAALAVLALASAPDPAATPGAALLGRLDAAEARYGVHATRQVSRRLPSVAVAAQVVAGLRAAPPSEVGGMAVRAVVDLAAGGGPAGSGPTGGGPGGGGPGRGGPGGLPAADVVVWRLEGGRVVVRPSGTEPKLKAYLEVVELAGPDLAAARARAATSLDRLAAGVGDLLDGGRP